MSLFMWLAPQIGGRIGEWENYHIKTWVNFLSYKSRDTPWQK